VICYNFDNSRVISPSRYPLLHSCQLPKRVLIFKESLDVF